MNRDHLYLAHISEAISRIESYIVEGRAAFLSSTLIQDAVVRNLQTLCESTQKLSASLKTAHPAVDWTGLAFVRNAMTHDYLGMDLENVWTVVSEDLPKLKAPIAQMLDEMQEL